MLTTPPKYCSKRLYYLIIRLLIFTENNYSFYSTYQNKYTELLRMSIILKNKKKNFLVSENKVICKGPPPASFICRGSWVQSSLGGRGGKCGFLATCLPVVRERSWWAGLLSGEVQPRLRGWMERTAPCSCFVPVHTACCLRNAKWWATGTWGPAGLATLGFLLDDVALHELVLRKR